MIELSKVQREIKVYINDKAYVFDIDKVKGQQLLQKAGFAANEYDIYFVEDKTKSRQVENDETIDIENGMVFNAVLKSG